MIDLDGLMAAQTAVFEAVRAGRDGLPEMSNLLVRAQSLRNGSAAPVGDTHAVLNSNVDATTPAGIAAIAAEQPDVLEFVIIRQTIVSARLKGLDQLEPFRNYVLRYGQAVLGLDEPPVLKPLDDLVYRLEKRAEIRRTAIGRKSVEEGKPDRIADLLDEAAAEIRRLRAA